jgi:hypothetical protein
MWSQSIQDKFTREMVATVRPIAGKKSVKEGKTL